MKTKTEIIAEIIDIDDEIVTLLCMLDPVRKIDQVRNFPIGPFMDFELKIGEYIKILTSIKSGEIKTQFVKDNHDYSELFKKMDLFSKLKDTAFFNEK